MLTLCPIGDAPIQPNSDFGPCLLGSVEAGDDYWSIGRWNGEGWYDADGAPITPALWAALPPLPVAE